MSILKIILLENFTVKDSEQRLPSLMSLNQRWGLNQIALKDSGLVNKLNMSSHILSWLKLRAKKTDILIGISI